LPLLVPLFVASLLKVNAFPPSPCARWKIRPPPFQLLPHRLPDSANCAILPLSKDGFFVRRPHGSHESLPPPSFPFPFQLFSFFSCPPHFLVLSGLWPSFCISMVFFSALDSEVISYITPPSPNPRVFILQLSHLYSLFAS